MLNSELYKRLLSYLKPYKLKAIMSLIALICLALSEPLLPLLIEFMLDNVFIKNDPQYRILVPLGFITIFFIRGVLELVSGIGVQWISHKVIEDVRAQQFKHLLHLPLSYYDKIPAGAILSKVTFDVLTLGGAVTTSLVSIIKDSIIIIGLFTYLLYLSWQLTIVIFFIIPVTIIIVKVVSKKMRRSSASVQEAMGEATQILEEAIEGRQVLKIFGAQKYEINRFYEKIRKVRQQSMKINAASSAYTPVVQFFIAMAMSVIVYFASIQSANGEITPGQFMGFFTALGMMFAPVKRLTKVNEHIQRGLAAATSVFELLDEAPERDAPNYSTTKKMKRLNGDIVFDKVAMAYEQTDTNAIKNFSYRFAPGTTTALVGKSGSGKSTIASLIPALYKIDSGKLTIDGKDINDMSLSDLRSQISYVSQEIVLFNDTLARNVSYGKPQASNKKIIEALKTANAWDFVKKLSNGIDTEIGNSGSLISGGERQRIAIARAILKNAPILILDEATSALDAESENLVQSSIDNLRLNRTVLIIAHNLTTIQSADQILFIQNGKILESGTHEELSKKDSEYAKFCQIQLSN